MEQNGADAAHENAKGDTDAEAYFLAMAAGTRRAGDGRARGRWSGRGRCGGCFCFSRRRETCESGRLTMYRSRKSVAGRGIEAGQRCHVCWHDGTAGVVVMHFFDALVLIAAVLVVGERAESPIRALSGVERVVELVI